MDRKLILFVEDSEHDREIYGKLLWYNGFDVVFATTGAEGLRLLETEAPRLMVLDLQLPDVTGMELCERLRADQRTARLPILILTGRTEREYGTWARGMGCAGFLEKPVTPLELLYEVERVIGRAPLPGEIVEEERRNTGAPAPRRPVFPPPLDLAASGRAEGETAEPRPQDAGSAGDPPRR